MLNLSHWCYSGLLERRHIDDEHGIEEAAGRAAGHDREN
jgi:hypothetical protein